MVRNLLIDVFTKKSEVVEHLRKAAQIVQLDPGEIELALEDQGVFENDRYTVVEIQ